LKSQSAHECESGITLQASSETATTAATSDHPSNIEYRPRVYYATNDEDGFDEDSGDEKTKLLADHDRRPTYFGRLRQRNRSGGEVRSPGDDDVASGRGLASTDVPDTDEIDSRLTSVVRIVVLGDRGVGKTTLARQLLTSEHLANDLPCVHLTHGQCASSLRLGRLSLLPSVGR